MAKEIFICICLLFTCSLSFKYFQSKIPNGDSVPHPCKPNYLWHGVGHRNEQGGGSRNPFGEDFDAVGKTWTHELCRKDSDGDGKTNGEELGDPSCIWREYAIPDKNAISHPGVCEPFNSSLCRSKNTWVQCELETFKCDAINQPVTNETTVPTICGMVPDSCLTIIGGWTVGTHGECAHKDVGFRIGQNGFKSAILQFHWNNPEWRFDYTDSSGMTLYCTPNRRPNDATIMVVGQDYLEIPPGKERVEVDAVCSSEDTRMILSGPVYITRSFNHMHYLGREEYIDLYRNGDKINTLTSEPDYNYDRLQISEYGYSIEVLPGDELRTKCVFKSSSKSFTTLKGDVTSDEMCYGFLTVHPMKNIRYPYCLSWRGLSKIQLHLYPFINGCDTKTFLNVSYPYMADIYLKIDQKCFPLSMCLGECKEVVKEIKLHPCLQGDIGKKLKLSAIQSGDVKALYFYSKIESCDLEMLQEDRLNQTKGNTNNGSQFFPHFLILVSLLFLMFI